MMPPIIDRVGRIFSIAFHPDYAENGLFYVHRVDPDAPAGLVTRFRVSCAVVGGMVYRGHLVPDLYGRYVYGDFCTGTI